MANTEQDNGCVACADDARAGCRDCDWEHDGSGQDCIDAAEEHVDVTGHTAFVDATLSVSVEP